jgi:hypothetical protein
MCQLILLTWKPGLDKIALNHELRSGANISLQQAKKYVDELLEGGNPVIYVESQEQANKLLGTLQAMGIVGRIEC